MGSSRNYAAQYTLPPGVSGAVHGTLGVAVERVVLGGLDSRMARCSVRLKWWGETGDGRTIRVPFEQGAEQELEASTIWYQILCGPEPFSRYLEDMRTLAIKLICVDDAADAVDDVLVGHAYLHLSLVSFEAPFQGVLPVYDEAAEECGRLHAIVSIAFDDGQDVDTDAGDLLSTSVAYAPARWDPARAPRAEVDSLAHPFATEAAPSVSSSFLLNEKRALFDSTLPVLGQPLLHAADSPGHGLYHADEDAEDGDAFALSPAAAAPAPGAARASETRGGGRTYGAAWQDDERPQEDISHHPTRRRSSALQSRRTSERTVVDSQAECAASATAACAETEWGPFMPPAEAPRLAGGYGGAQAQHGAQTRQSRQSAREPKRTGEVRKGESAGASEPQPLLAQTESILQRAERLRTAMVESVRSSLAAPPLSSRRDERFLTERAYESEERPQWLGEQAPIERAASNSTAFSCPVHSFVSEPQAAKMYEDATTRCPDPFYASASADDCLLTELFFNHTPAHRAAPLPAPPVPAAGPQYPLLGHGHGIVASIPPTHSEAAPWLQKDQAPSCTPEPARSPAHHAPQAQLAPTCRSHGSANSHPCTLQLTLEIGRAHLRDAHGGPLKLNSYVMCRLCPLLLAETQLLRTRVCWGTADPFFGFEHSTAVSRPASAEVRAQELVLEVWAIEEGSHAESLVGLLRARLQLPRGLEQQQFATTLLSGNHAIVNPFDNRDCGSIEVRVSLGTADQLLRSQRLAAATITVQHHWRTARARRLHSEEAAERAQASRRFAQTEPSTKAVTQSTARSRNATRQDTLAAPSAPSACYIDSPHASNSEAPPTQRLQSSATAIISPSDSGVQLLPRKYAAKQRLGDGRVREQLGLLTTSSDTAAHFKESNADPPGICDLFKVDALHPKHEPPSRDVTGAAVAFDSSDSCSSDSGGTARHSSRDAPRQWANQWFLSFRLCQISGLAEACSGSFAPARRAASGMLAAEGGQSSEALVYVYYRLFQDEGCILEPISGETACAPMSTCAALTHDETFTLRTSLSDEPFLGFMQTQAAQFELWLVPPGCKRQNVFDHKLFGTALLPLAGVAVGVQSQCIVTPLGRARAAVHADIGFYLSKEPSCAPLSLPSIFRRDVVDALDFSVAADEDAISATDFADECAVPPMQKKGSDELLSAQTASSRLCEDDPFPALASALSTTCSDAKRFDRSAAELFDNADSQAAAPRARSLPTLRAELRVSRVMLPMSEGSHASRGMAYRLCVRLPGAEAIISAPFEKADCAADTSGSSSNVFVRHECVLAASGTHGPTLRENQAEVQLLRCPPRYHTSGFGEYFRSSELEETEEIVGRAFLCFEDALNQVSYQASSKTDGTGGEESDVVFTSSTMHALLKMDVGCEPSADGAVRVALSLRRLGDVARALPDNGHATDACLTPEAVTPAVAVCGVRAAPLFDEPRTIFGGGQRPEVAAPAAPRRLQSCMEELAAMHAQLQARLAESADGSRSTVAAQASVGAARGQSCTVPRRCVDAVTYDATPLNAAPAREPDHNPASLVLASGSPVQRKSIEADPLSVEPFEEACFQCIGAGSRDLGSSVAAAHLPSVRSPSVAALCAADLTGRLDRVALPTDDDAHAQYISKAQSAEPTSPSKTSSPRIAPDAPPGQGQQDANIVHDTPVDEHIFNGTELPSELPFTDACKTFLVDSAANPAIPKTPERARPEVEPRKPHSFSPESLLRIARILHGRKGSLTASLSEVSSDSDSDDDVAQVRE